jgi:hypothetical protein
MIPDGVYKHNPLPEPSHGTFYRRTSGGKKTFFLLSDLVVLIKEINTPDADAISSAHMSNLFETAVSASLLKY